MCKNPPSGIFGSRLNCKKLEFNKNLTLEVPEEI